MKKVLFFSSILCTILLLAEQSSNPIETLPKEVICIADDIATMIINRKAEQSPEEKKETAIKLVAHVTSLATEITKIIIEKRQTKRSLSIESREIQEEITQYLSIVYSYITHNVHQATS